MPRPHLPQLPTPPEWDVPPARWFQPDADGLTIVAAGRTDLFHDPSSDATVANSPRLLFPVAGPCLLSARVTVGFRDTFDAGVLLIDRAPDAWGKLCFERSPQGVPTIVSVVTRGRSDDANAWSVDGDSVWLRIAVLEQAFAFHASDDGERWSLIRHFSLGGSAPTRLGFSCQAPVGEGCTATFRHIGFRSDLLADIRSGG